MRRQSTRLALAAGILCAVIARATAQQGWEPVVAAVDAARPGPAAATNPALAAPRPKAAPSPAVEAFMAPAQVVAQEQRPAAVDPATALARTRKPAEALALQTDAARQYCINIANAATDAKFALQKRTLAEIERELDKRIALLEAKIGEYQTWVTRRDEFVKKARENVVLIYARMRPESAAMQLVAMDEETAAAVLIKLDPRIASTILNEMEPTRAARLTATISGATKIAPSPRPQPGAEEKKS